MQTVEDQKEAGLVIFLNQPTISRTRDYPEWTSSLQREKWSKQGVILWNGETQQVTRLNSHQALSLLKQLRDGTKWKEQGCIVGEPSLVISLDKPKNKGEIVLWDKLSLNPRQTHMLFDFLVQEEKLLQQMREAEEKFTQSIMNRVYDEILSWGEHTVYNNDLSWEENKRTMRHLWDSQKVPDNLTETDRKLLWAILDDIGKELDQASQLKQEQELRMRNNLLSHRFFWERIKSLWPHLKADERLQILNLLQGVDWNQGTVAEVKQIIENAQFFEVVEKKIGGNQEGDKISSDEIDLLIDLEDQVLWKELWTLYQFPKMASKKA